MPPVPPASIKGKGKAVSYFSDDEEHGEAGEPVPLTQNGRKRKHQANGQPNGAEKRKKKLMKKKKPKSSKDAEEERARIAAELLLTRYELPFYQGRRHILDQIVKNDTVVIIGETGCGKSTQLGQLLRRHSIAAGHWPYGPSVAITQPRRLPTISLASRVAAEMGVVLGSEVGYSVRFEDVTSRDTRLRFLTEGVLMRELANAQQFGKDKAKEPNGKLKEESEGEGKGKGKAKGKKRANGTTGDDGLNLLLRYDVVVIDEAHERTLNTDFLLGCLRKIQEVRREMGHPLKVVIMSATLDPKKFTDFFGGCPALHVPGRMFDVATSHVTKPVDDFIEAAAEAVMMIHNRKPSPPGEVLVFMPGSDEIETVVALLRRRANELPPDAQGLQVLPLYAALPPTAQAKIFAPVPPKTRRIVVSTNVAETSLTIPGIAFVVDSGFRKEKEYIHRASGAIEHLRKTPISQASAWQRTGRAGREMAGECLRLYTEAAFFKMAMFDTPEIQRCNLSNAVLQLIAMRQDPFTFGYLDPPSRDAVAAAFRALAGLGAISSPTQITPRGRDMLRYPLEPEHARILLAGFEGGCASEIIDVLSLVVAGQVFVDRGDTRDAAAAARAKFVHRDGDHLTGMNVLRAYIALKEDLQEGEGAGGVGGVGAWCRANYVNGRTLAQAVRIRAQLRDLAIRFGRDPESCAEPGAVGAALLAGLFMNTAVIQADGSYKQTAGALVVKIHPSSVLAGRKVPAIVYDELAITSAIYARGVSAFDQNLLSEIPWFRAAARPVERKAA
ncbi:P-loop containing nucleoside triphosphate hydrolase protein [Cutaneotrichosporon oleaginosum]|uniref:RNA helicase n=1 Tax=Cutaneotrichosporon oleaginosum TaxID=879819 RepID=A0A0J0XFG6_9TREE|nr:P-loop containing nucleoside triphosphate hydrolase protein [Cutaneotrichosporon oleaginosum]KLT39812.1 P-loop containing nucleoside triphosphate hydrolase protein [Cutaneotrichosporon oleaginosum]TXT10336.1 hypothetical protein COLE_04270 [Cutaneotrichosporon oleaginosum]